MSKLIKVLGVRENAIDMRVAAAFITFTLKGDNVIDIAQIPSPRECHVPENLMWDAKKQAKAILLEKSERKEKIQKAPA